MLRNVTKPRIGLNPVLHDYQREMVHFAFSRLVIDDDSGAGLLADPGLGKTLVTLELIRKMRQHGLAKRVLIIAPLDVCYNTWPDQIDEWEYPWTPKIVHSPTNNTPAFRSKQLEGKGNQIHIINPEGIRWLSTQKKATFDLVVIDESTKFKTWGSARTQALRSMVEFGRTNKVLILTGTPTPNGYQDIFAQIWMLDRGKALGPNITYFRNWAMKQGGFNGWQWEILDEVIPQIEKCIAPLVMRVDAEDHLDLPHVHDNRVLVSLPKEAREIYNSVERELFADLESGDTLVASNAGAKYTLCRQIANGGGYAKDESEEKYKVCVHDAKVEAARRIVDELNGNPVIIAYQFDHDVDRLHKVWKYAPAIRGGMKATERRKIIQAWNRKEVPVLLVQPAALSHGANMQAGGANMIWLGLTDQLELFDQLKKRIWRQGQQDECRFHYILAKNTVDLAVEDRLTRKGNGQAALLDSLKQYRLEKAKTNAVT